MCLKIYFSTNNWLNCTIGTYCVTISTERVKVVPSNQGATHSSLSACLMMVSGRGRECLTMAPYNPYSAMMLPRPHVLLVFLSLALRFWNQTWDNEISDGWWMTNDDMNLICCWICSPDSSWWICGWSQPTWARIKTVTINNPRTSWTTSNSSQVLLIKYQ